MSKSDGAQWWFTSMFGALLGTLLRESRAKKRIAPMPPPIKPIEEEDQDKAQEEVEPHIPASTQLGQLLHETFDDPLMYEKVFVNQKGYRTVMMARWMTPQVFRQVASLANMPKGHMDRFREALAPPDFESRSKYPIFASF